MNKFKSFMIAVVVIGVLVLGLYFFFTGDRQNKIARMQIQQFEGNYTVIDSTYNGDKVYTITKGKVTSDPQKGYYYFWADNPNGGKKLYTQVPMERTSIQERH